MNEKIASNEDIAALLDRAEQEQTSILPLSEMDTIFTPQRAYEVQRAWLKLKLARGERLAGHKVGLTSQPMQLQLGVNEPDYGFLLESMIIQSGKTLPFATFIAPRVEPEIAFLLKEDLRGPRVTMRQVLQATKGVSAALELIDSRIIDWRIKLVDTIADNASSARVILGERVISPGELDLAGEHVTLLRNGDAVGMGNGAAVLNHPAAAIAWLANKLAEFDITLRAGQWIIPGSMCAAGPVAAGDTYSAVFDTLGEISVSFR